MGDGSDSSEFRFPNKPNSYCETAMSKIPHFANRREFCSVSTHVFPENADMTRQ